MFGVDRLPFPEGDGAATLAAFEALAASGRMAAIILEPLVLGAGGCGCTPPRFWPGCGRSATATTC